jgi:hypothetical protein
MKTRLISVLALACAASLLTAGTATAASDKLIVVKKGKVRSFGGFAAQGPAPNTTTAAAVFGPGTVLQDSETVCIVTYPPEGVEIHFVNLGSPGLSACDPAAGKSQTLSTTGPGWHTNRGLAIGDSLGKLRKLYKQRKLRKGRYELVGRKSPYGFGRETVLSAVVTARRVTELTVFAGSAGE